jgi:hypothetical protein
MYFFLCQHCGSKGFSTRTEFLISHMHATFLTPLLCNMWDFSVFLCIDYEHIWKLFYHTTFFFFAKLLCHFVNTDKTFQCFALKIGSHEAVGCQVSVIGQEKIMSHTGSPHHYTHSLPFLIGWKTAMSYLVTKCNCLYVKYWYWFFPVKIMSNLKLRLKFSTPLFTRIT